MRMADRPIGIFTFLFTDIDGSTRLWEQQPKAMRAALAQHDTLLHQAIEASGGHVFKTVGDAFCAVFSAPEAALQAAISAQRALPEELPEVRVRMAIHTGEADAVGEDYLGPALNRVARLLAAGHGGQVLLSEATADALRSSVPPEAHLRPLGAHRLRDLAAREVIFQLVAPHLPDQFPALNTLDVAFRRGIRRATAIAAAVVIAMASLTVAALRQKQMARAAAAKERAARRWGQRLL
jgi:class 3 adenylate cyclase